MTVQRTSKERIQELANALCDVFDTVQKAEVALADAQEQYKLVKTCLEKTVNPDIVQIDVGGTPFHVCKSTLRAQPHSMLATLISGHFADNEGNDECFFLDRDPSLFPHVLDYLRGTDSRGNNDSGMEVDNETDAAPLPLTPHMQRALMREARYYGLDGLCQRLDSALSTPNFTELSTDIKCEPQGHIVATHAGSMTYSAGLASHGAIAHGRHSWYIRLCTTPTLIFLGFAPRDGFRLEPNRAYANSYACPNAVLFYTGNGYIYTPGTPTPLKQYYTGSRDSLKAAGTVIGAHIDMNTQHVAFTVNSQCFGLVHIAGMNKPLFPVFELMGPGSFEIWSPQL